MTNDAIEYVAGLVASARAMGLESVTTRLDLDSGEKVYVEIFVKTGTIRPLDRPSPLAELIASIQPH